MFWFTYLLAVILFCFLVNPLLKRVYLVLLFVILLTPNQVEVGSEFYSPAIFTFLFDLLFEQKFSFRVLRPLVLSLPLSFLLLWALNILKKRFF